MLSPIGTFLLFVAALTGTTLFFLNPVVKLERWGQGKKKSQIETEIMDKINKEPGNTLMQGCGFLIFFLVSLFFNFVVEPLVVITAVVNKIGYQPIAYAVSVIVAISLLKTIIIILITKKKTKNKIVINTTDGKWVEGTIEDDETFVTGNEFLNTLKHLLFFIPILYIWYIFLIAIGILK